MDKQTAIQRNTIALRTVRLVPDLQRNRAGTAHTPNDAANRSNPHPSPTVDLRSGAPSSAQPARPTTSRRCALPPPGPNQHRPVAASRPAPRDGYLAPRESSRALRRASPSPDNQRPLPARRFQTNSANAVTQSHALAGSGTAAICGLALVRVNEGAGLTSWKAASANNWWTAVVG